METNTVTRQRKKERERERRVMFGDVTLQVIVAVLRYAMLPNVSKGCCAFIFRVKEGRR